MSAEQASQPPPLPNLLVELRGPVVYITLNRPAKLNAVDTAMTGDWEQVVDWLRGREDLRVAIVTGAGKAFCAGDDVKELGQLSLKQAEELSLRQARMYLAFEKLPQVFIAAVNGHAQGAGCVCAYSCDFRLASYNARFGMPEILLGWSPGYGLAQLTAILGKARALELCLTGTSITARQAKEYGLVHRLVPHGRLLAAARELAEHFLTMPTLALRETKWRIHGDEPPQYKIAYEQDTAAYVRCLGTEDAREGIASFVEKRKAGFKGK